MGSALLPQLRSFFRPFYELRHLTNPDALADAPYPFQVRFVRRVPESDVRAHRLFVRLPIENRKLTILANDQESVEVPAEQRFRPTIGLQAAEPVHVDAPGHARPVRNLFDVASQDRATNVSPLTGAR
jgi:hypothetical protein